jgi:glycopeptide antibiotics resistance protein
VQVGGNLLVFAAAGFLLPVRWPVGIGTVLLAAAGVSAVVEGLQYALDLGRVSSVDDVLVNALGAGLAAALSKVVWPRSRQVSEAIVAR